VPTSCLVYKWSLDERNSNITSLDNQNSEITLFVDITQFLQFYIKRLKINFIIENIMSLQLIISHSLIIISILKIIQFSKKHISLYLFILIIISFFQLLYLISDKLTFQGITYEIAYRNEYWTRGKGTQSLNEAISEAVINLFLFLIFFHLFFFLFFRKIRLNKEFKFIILTLGFVTNPIILQISKIVYENKFQELNITQENTEYSEKDRYIAHAGGAVENYLYSNSLEALNTNWGNGFKYFELDIHQTSDGIYVAVHDWNEWKQSSGYQDQLPPNLEDFKKYKIYGKFTPLDIDDINHWFSFHEEAVLITDKIRNPVKFANKFLHKNRLMMEIFSLEALNDLKQINIKSIANWDILLENFPGDEKSIIKGILDNDIKYIAVSRFRVKDNRRLFYNITKMGVKIYVYHVNYEDGKDEKYVICNEFGYIFGMYADNFDFSKNVSCD